MKPREFYKILEDFVKEDKRWRSMKPGDTIYQVGGAGLDIDYFEAEIIEVDVDERTVRAYDRSHPLNRDTIITLTHFALKSEINI